MSKSRAWMPLHVGDLTVDTARLDESAFGIYMRLIIECWQQGGFKTDDRTVCSIAHCTLKRWRAAGEVVMSFFDVDDDGYATHHRVLKELRRTTEISMKRRGAAMQMHMQVRSKRDANTLHPSRARPYHNQVSYSSLEAEYSSAKPEAVAEEARPAPADPPPAASVGRRDLPAILAAHEDLVRPTAKETLPEMQQRLRREQQERILRAERWRREGLTND